MQPLPLTYPLRELSGLRLPDIDPAVLCWQIRRRNFARIQRLSESELAALPETFDPGPEYD